MKKEECEPLPAASALTPLTESLSCLFGEHNRRVLRAAFRITGTMADAEDVLQTVFLRMAALERPLENADSYLYRAAINGALDLLRRRKAAASEPLEQADNVISIGAGSSPEVEATNSQLGNTLRLAISELSPRAAEMFTLRYLEDLGNREIAALMGTSQAVVAVTLHNARSRLRKRLSEMGGQINATR